MIDILFYRLRTDPQMREFRDHYRQSRDIVFTHISDVLTLEKDMDRYRPSIVAIDHNLASVQDYLILKTIKNLSTRDLYVLICVPSFMDTSKLLTLIHKNWLDIVVSAAASLGEFHSIIRFIKAKIDSDAMYTDSFSFYRDTVDEYRNNKKLLLKKDEHIHQLKTEIKSMAMVDKQTGIANESYFRIQSENALEDAQYYRMNSCLLALRIDNQNSLEEFYGKPAIEFIYGEIGGLIRRGIRHSDLCAVNEDRSGFLIFYREIAPTFVLSTCHKLKHILEDFVFAYEKKALRITVSIGAATVLKASKQIYQYEKLLFQARMYLDNAVKKGGCSIVV